MERITSSDRAYGLVVVLLLVLWPILSGDIHAREDITGQLFVELWVWEISLLAVPMVVLAMKRRISSTTVLTRSAYACSSLDAGFPRSVHRFADAPSVCGGRVACPPPWTGRHSGPRSTHLVPQPVYGNESFLFTRTASFIEDVGLPFNELLGLNSIVGVC